MSPKIEIEEGHLRFNFNKYVTIMLSLVPIEKLIGLAIIRILTNNPTRENFNAKYIPLQDGKQCEIEINLASLYKENIPKYIFNRYPEIAALLLSEYIFHEIGHHIHSYKKHGIKKDKHEMFANAYAKKGYFEYIKHRKRKILASYFLASIDIFMFNRQERKMFAENQKEIIKWYNEMNAHQRGELLGNMRR